MIVDSSATIGFFAVRASATSGEKSIRSATLIAHRFHRGGRERPLQGYRQSSLRSMARLGGGGREVRAIRSADSRREPKAHTKRSNGPQARERSGPARPCAAIRQARVEHAERAEAIADLREFEIERLKALESARKPVIDQAPPHIDLFGLARAPCEHSRLFGIIAFVDMAHDKRAYRFFQDTRYGRGANRRKPVGRRHRRRRGRLCRAPSGRARTRVGRRLARRRGVPATTAASANRPPAGPIARPRTRALHLPVAGGPEPASAAGEPRVRRGFAPRLGDTLSMCLMLLGSITLALLIGLGACWVRRTRLRDLLDLMDRRAAVLNTEPGLDLPLASHDNCVSSDRWPPREGRRKS